jgi:hypothetical protein
MECAEIRPRLSEYLDGILDHQTKGLVRKHLSECVACSEALESLQTLVQELGNLRPVKPPDDFLEQLHGRMAKRSGLRVLRKMLFVPFQVKIPLQFATAAAMGVLIFFIIRTPEIEKKISEMPKQEAIIKGVEKADKEDFLRKPSAMEAESVPSVTKGGETIELVLVLEPKDESDLEFLTHNELVSRLKDLLHKVKGAVLSAEYDRKTGRTSSLNAQIPAKQYGFFCEELQKLGPLQSPPPAVKLNDTEFINLLIHLIRP